jgi:D-alanyl-D-alanine carboxypeptidase (penicillin-binding protein 5/6)
MRHTTYTDPSGFDPATRSTAADQVLLARAAMRLPLLRALVGRASYRLPVAGTVHNTDRLLGKDGFAGLKTGSMDASGGCFMFLSHRSGGELYGVVLGQHGHSLVDAGLYAAEQLADRVAPRVPAALR